VDADAPDVQIDTGSPVTVSCSGFTALDRIGCWDFDTSPSSVSPYNFGSTQTTDTSFSLTTPSPSGADAGDALRAVVAATGGQPGSGFLGRSVDWSKYSHIILEGDAQIRGWSGDMARIIGFEFSDCTEAPVLEVSPNGSSFNLLHHHGTADEAIPGGTVNINDRFHFKLDLAEPAGQTSVEHFSINGGTPTAPNRGAMQATCKNAELKVGVYGVTTKVGQTMDIVFDQLTLVGDP
jgi:hypothetical protein